MAKSGGVFLLDENDRRKLHELWEWKRGLSGRGVSNTPFGGVVNVHRAGDEAPPSIPFAQTIVRISATSNAGVNFKQGNYAGYIQIAGSVGSGTTAANLGMDKAVAMGSLGFTDGEFVAIKNMMESTSISSTSIAHLLTANDYVPVAAIVRGPVTIGTNSCRLVFVRELPGLTC